LTGRLILAAAGLLLLATAAFHATGAADAATWLGGARGDFVRVLWWAPTVDWAVIGSFWLWAAARSYRGAGVVVTALLPLGTAALMSAFIDPLFPGTLMLVAASALALVSQRLR
jgi:hypothetical protein